MTNEYGRWESATKGKKEEKMAKGKKGDIVKEAERVARDAERALEELGSLKIPEVGDDIYIPTALYVYRGRDDIIGGLTRVIAVQKEGRYIWVTVAACPHGRYSWDYLAGIQEKLKEEFGTQHAYPNPDLRPEFNDSEADWGEPISFLEEE